MRVAVDCHMAGSPRPGDAGNGRYAVTLTTALAASAAPGDDCWALIAEPSVIQVLDRRVRYAGVPHSNVRRLLNSAPRALRAIRADHAVFTYVAPMRGTTPVALAIHDASFMTHPEWLPPRARIMLRRMVPLSLRRAHSVWALSRTAAAEISEALDVEGDRIHVVSPGVAPHFGPDEAAAARVADRFGLAAYCLAVGDLNPRKNIPALIEAVARLDRPGLELVLVGDAPRWAGPGASGRVRWLGRTDDATLADLYRAAAMTAFPSLHEGFGLPAVEAMASGCPLVVSDRGALPEVVGDAALVVPPTPEGLADGLRAALEPATADALRAAGPARAAVYSPAAMGRQAWDALRAEADPP